MTPTPEEHLANAITQKQQEIAAEISRSTARPLGALATLPEETSAKFRESITQATIDSLAKFTGELQPTLRKELRLAIQARGPEMADQEVAHFLLWYEWCTCELAGALIGGSWAERARSLKMQLDAWPANPPHPAAVN